MSRHKQKEDINFKKKEGIIIINKKKTKTESRRSKRA
jgi:hypothetical protein